MMSSYNNIINNNIEEVLTIVVIDHVCMLIYIYDGGDNDNADDGDDDRLYELNHKHNYHKYKQT